MMPVTHMPAHDASQLPPVFFSRELPGTGSAGGSKKPPSKPSSKPSKPAPKKPGGGKPSKKR